MAKRRVWDTAYKREAVRQLEAGGKPAAQLALELGVSRVQLYKWREQVAAKGEGAFRGPGARSDGDELARVKRELERVREERDILKKAAAYFARELP